MSGGGSHGARDPRQSQTFRRGPVGAPPGTLVADPDALPTEVHVIAFGSADLNEQTLDDVAELAPLLGRSPVTWVNVNGLADIDVVKTIGEIFNVHPLVLEDVLNVHQRAKVESYEDYLFVVARLPATGEGFDHEQLSMFIGEGFVVTFQERPGDCFEPVRDRLRSGRPRIRGGGSDYLAYCLLDALVDAYFPVLEHFGEGLARLEEHVLEEPDSTLVPQIRGVGRDLLGLRRVVWPLRDALGRLLREETRLVTDETRVFLRDCYDHAHQLMDAVEHYREIASGLMDLYLSSLSNRMNEIMKVLTIIATIFIPLSFIAGLYGMNFDPERSPWNMPELAWYWGYPFALGIMGAVTLGLLVYFRRKGWLGS